MFFPLPYALIIFAIQIEAVRHPGKIRAAPAWNPDDVRTVIPPRSPPLPPIDPEDEGEEDDDHSILPIPPPLEEASGYESDESSNRVNIESGPIGPPVRIRRPPKNYISIPMESNEETLNIPISPTFRRPASVLPKPPTMLEVFPFGSSEDSPHIIVDKSNGEGLLVPSPRRTTVIEEVEIPEELLNEIYTKQSPIPVVYERMVLRKASGKFPAKDLRRSERTKEPFTRRIRTTTRPPITSTSAPITQTSFLRRRRTNRYGQKTYPARYVSAQSKLNVILVDQNQEILDRSKKNIATSLQRVAKKQFKEDKEKESFVSDILRRISFIPTVSEGVKNADLVIEAIVENVGAKQKLFAEVESNAPSDALLATNTSSLRLRDVGAKLQRKEQFGGLHFFNPVPMMKLLEVVRGEQTSDETFKSFLEYGKAVGKITVECKDTPGFIVNRLLIPYMFEALFMAGDATIKDIDTAMKIGAGYPMGPFQLADYVGLDTLKFIQDGWKEHDPKAFKESVLLNKLVSEGKTGVKSGEGFFKY